MTRRIASNLKRSSPDSGSGPRSRSSVSPSGNGVIERWIRTPKEECFYLHDFETLEEAREMIGGFIESYNQEWLIERHGHRAHADVRRQLLQAT